MRLSNSTKILPLVLALALTSNAFSGSQTSAGVPDLIAIDCEKTVIYKDLLNGTFYAELEGEIIPNVSVFNHEQDRTVYVESIRSHYGSAYQLEVRTDLGTPDGFQGTLKLLNEEEEDLNCPTINLEIIDS